MAAKATLVGGMDFTAKGITAVGTIALTGNYGGSATHGDTLDLSALGVPSQQAPIVLIWEAPTAGSGVTTVYRFTYCPGTTQANGLLQIMGAAAEYTQASAYSSNFPNTLYFMAIFPKFI